jgi:hypothetical protein
MARFVDHSAQVRAAYDAGAVQGLTLASEHLLQVSRGRVPLEEGTLERSGVASVDEATKRAAVSYDTSYAVRQHEDLALRHDGGRTAKYLEIPTHTEGKVMLDLIHRAVANRLR